ncbi:hypothetical protein CRG98_045205 [Punica granatum]|uniref:Uncharacterized protein n=1 Tax=Punica granatum TaxID=22663 RepID=A0A2I0HRR8_PUNGR|nr:hypothetical protein CRG98_045205 [Punica granatum]
MKLQFVLGENGMVAVFTDDAPVACEHYRRELVSPLKRLLAGNAPVSLLGLLLARRLLVAPPDAGPAGMVVLY